MCHYQEHVQPMEAAEREIEMERYRAMKAERMASRRAEALFREPEAILQENADIVALREQVGDPSTCIVCVFCFACLCFR